MGYTTYESYSLAGGLSGAAFLDSTTYLIGDITPQTSTANYGRLYIPRTGTVRKVYVHWYNVTQDCTAEDTTISLRKNNTSDSTGSYTGSLANAATPCSFDANLSVAMGDYLHLKVVCPAWVTNPTGTYINFIVEIQC